MLQKEAPFLSSMATCYTNIVEEIVQNKVQLVPLLQDVQKCTRTMKDWSPNVCLPVELTSSVNLEDEWKFSSWTGLG